MSMKKYLLCLCARGFEMVFKTSIMNLKSNQKMYSFIQCSTVNCIYKNYKIMYAYFPAWNKACILEKFRKCQQNKKLVKLAKQTCAKLK